MWYLGVGERWDEKDGVSVGRDGRDTTATAKRGHGDADEAFCVVDGMALSTAE